jgi:hypothetical protein
MYSILSGIEIGDKINLMKFITVNRLILIFDMRFFALLRYAQNDSDLVFLGGGKRRLRRRLPPPYLLHSAKTVILSDSEESYCFSRSVVKIYLNPAICIFSVEIAT